MEESLFEVVYTPDAYIAAVSGLSSLKLTWEKYFFLCQAIVQHLWRKVKSRIDNGQAELEEVEGERPFGWGLKKERAPRVNRTPRKKT